MPKYPIFIQDEEMSCGAYCILMILKYYGYQEEVSKVKKKARLNQNGISIKGIIECLKDYQIEAVAYQADLKDIREQIQLPCILYLLNEDIGHFVVLYAIKDEEYIIGDPAKGLISLYQEELETCYTKRMISIQHVGRVPSLHYRPYYCFLLDIFQMYRPQMLQLIYKGLWIAILSYLSSYFYQILIDDIHLKTRFFYMFVLCLTYGLIEIIKIMLHQAKMRQIIHLQKAIDEDCVFQTSMNIFQLPYSFFYQDKGQIQSQMTQFFELSEMSIEYFEKIFLDGLMFIVYFIGMFWIHPLMSVGVCVMFMIISLLSVRYLRKLQIMHKDYLEAHFRYQHHLLELIENHILIRFLSFQQKTRERSYHIYLDEALSKEKQSLYINQYQHIIQYIIYLFYILIMIFGFYEFKHRALSLGQVLMFYMLVSYSIEPLMNILSVVLEYKQTSLVYEKYKAFQEIEEDKQIQIQDPIRSIVLDDVGYAYGYQLPIFEHMDIKINNHTLIKGKTGSGKSTLLRLLMGYDMNYRGHIYINDQELRDISLSSLYHHIGYVDQTPTFLHMSLYDNFLCDDKEKIQSLLKCFHQEELISMFHLTLNEDGSPLSLGQRQVVAIIRLLCQEFDVYILDEAFSHMDQKLSQTVQRYLYTHDQNKIYIVVNHQTKLVKKGWDCVIIDDKK